jgi:hypothetical protein
MSNAKSDAERLGECFPNYVPESLLKPLSESR